jgi:arginine/lysine/ornithine decarboxylase
MINEVSSVKAGLSRAGYRIIGSEPMKIALDVADYGYSGSYVYEYLKDLGIIAEFADGEHIVFMPSEKSDISELKALERALLSLPRREVKSCRAPRFSLPKRDMSICEAMSADSELLPLGECIGRVVADIRVGCPPAVAPIVPGEIVDENISETLAYYGISELYVVKI